MKDSAIRIGISFVCTALIVIHHVWPKLTVDLPTLILVALALLPWLASVFKSIELPGGVKIELHDIKAATDKIQSQGIVTSVSPEAPPLGSQASAAAERDVPSSTARPDDDFGSIATIGSADPNLALVGIRIEIERRLAKLAEHTGVRRRSAGVMLRDLVARGVLERQRAGGLQELIALGNEAAHGAQVSFDAARWSLDVAPSILGYLDDEILSAKPK